VTVQHLSATVSSCTILSFKYPLQVAPLAHDTWGCEHFRYDRTRGRKAELGLAAAAVFSLQEAAAIRRQDHVTLPAGDRAPLELIQADLVS
jgi:hypothetical protein